MRTAVCLAGNARTFPDPRVVGRLSGFLDELRREQSALVDVFAYMTLTGAPRKDQLGWEFPAVNSSKAETEAALTKLRPKAYDLVDSAEEVTPQNAFLYARDLECLRQGVWRSPRNLLRSLNHLVHVQRCLLKVLQEENRTRLRYDVVLIARPDLMVYNISKPIVRMAAEGTVFHLWDWFFAMQREVADSLLDRSRAMPLTCTKEQWCCGKLGRSEDMFEYILRAPMSARCSLKMYLCNYSYSFAHGSQELEAGIAGDVLRPPESP